VVAKQGLRHALGRVDLQPRHLTDIAHKRHGVERSIGQTPEGARGQRRGARGDNSAERARGRSGHNGKDSEVADRPAGIGAACVLAYARLCEDFHKLPRLVS
jgi:hypothetical protein